MTDFVWSIDDAGMGNAALVDATRRMAHFFESRLLL